MNYFKCHSNKDNRMFRSLMLKEKSKIMVKISSLFTKNKIKLKQSYQFSLDNRRECRMYLLHKKQCPIISISFIIQSFHIDFRSCFSQKDFSFTSLSLQIRERTFGVYSQQSYITPEEYKSQGQVVTNRNINSPQQQHYKKSRKIYKESKEKRWIRKSKRQ